MIVVLSNYITIIIYSCQTTRWCVGVDPKSGSHDQLHVANHKVIWYQGLDPTTQTIRKVYGTETVILQAFWGHFSDRGAGVSEGVARAVCIRERGYLGIYMETGSVYYTPFPFPVSSCNIGPDVPIPQHNPLPDIRCGKCGLWDKVCWLSG